MPLLYGFFTSISCKFGLGEETIDFNAWLHIGNANSLGILTDEDGNIRTASYY